VESAGHNLIIFDETWYNSFLGTGNSKKGQVLIKGEIYNTITNIHNRIVSLRIFLRTTGPKKLPTTSPHEDPG
jgi:hypothetical protein